MLTPSASTLDSCADRTGHALRPVPLSSAPFSNLCMQVNTVEQPALPLYKGGAGSADGEPGATRIALGRRHTWARRLRSLLCCFIPLVKEKYRKWPDEQTAAAQSGRSCAPSSHATGSCH